MYTRCIVPWVYLDKPRAAQIHRLTSQNKTWRQEEKEEEWSKEGERSLPSCELLEDEHWTSATFRVCCLHVQLAPRYFRWMWPCVYLCCLCTGKREGVGGGGRGKKIQPYVRDNHSNIYLQQVIFTALDTRKHNTRHSFFTHLHTHTVTQILFQEWRRNTKRSYKFLEGNYNKWSSPFFSKFWTSP